MSDRERETRHNGLVIAGIFSVCLLVVLFSCFGGGRYRGGAWYPDRIIVDFDSGLVDQGARLLGGAEDMRVYNATHHNPTWGDTVGDDAARWRVIVATVSISHSSHLTSTRSEGTIYLKHAGFYWREVDGPWIPIKAEFDDEGRMTALLDEGDPITTTPSGTLPASGPSLEMIELATEPIALARGWSLQNATGEARDCRWLTSKSYVHWGGWATMLGIWLGVSTLLFLVPLRDRFRKQPRAHCPCGYNRDGIRFHARCPECGREWYSRFHSR